MTSLSDILFLGSLPWILYFVFLFWASKVHNNEYGAKLLVLFLILFSSLRYGIGYDYYEYKAIVTGTAPDYAIERWELLPQYIAVYCRDIHYQLFFVITSLLSICPIYFVCKKASCNPFHSLLIFALYPQFFLLGLGPVRNAVAYAFVFLMYYYIWEKRNIKISIICFIIAVFFHKSSVIACLIFFIPYILRGLKSNLILFLLSFVASFLIIPISGLLLPFFGMEDSFGYYLNNAEKFAGGGMYRYIVNAVALFNFLFWNRIKNYNHQNIRLLALVNIGACLFNTLISISPVFAIRMFLFFWFFIILLFPTYQMAMVGKKIVSMKSIGVSCGLLMLFTFIMQYYNYVNYSIRMSYIPYQFFFDYVDFDSITGFNM